MSEPLHLLLVGRLSHFEDQRGLAKPEVLCGNVTVQEDVDTCQKKKGENLKNPDVIMTLMSILTTGKCIYMRFIWSNL